MSRRYRGTLFSLHLVFPTRFSGEGVLTRPRGISYLEQLAFLFWCMFILCWIIWYYLVVSRAGILFVVAAHSLTPELSIFGVVYVAVLFVKSQGDVDRTDPITLSVRETSGLRSYDFAPGHRYNR